VKSVVNKFFRLRASVALVYKDRVLNLFKTNIRENVFLKIDYEKIIELLLEFDGYQTIKNIAKKNNISLEVLTELVLFLNNKFILIEVDKAYPKELIKKNYRTINFLEDYFHKTSDVISALYNLRNKVVMIIGLGAVGTWITDLLARNGIEKFILVDDDIVEFSNLHRQHLYFEKDIGKYKVDCIEHYLKFINHNIQIKKIKSKLKDNFFNNFKDKIDLIINCADYPSVDYTTNIIGKFCMKNNIPHIIGGGYNLHLTLIGQTVVPYETACYECFNKKLQEINKPFTQGVRKLNRKNRKIGSFAPLSTLSASLSALDAFKVLCNLKDFIINDSKRIEFNLKTMDFNIMKIHKNPECKVCSNLK